MLQYIVYKNLHNIRYMVLKELKQFLKCVSAMSKKIVTYLCHIIWYLLYDLTRF